MADSVGGDDVTSGTSEAHSTFPVSENGYTFTSEKTVYWYMSVALVTLTVWVSICLCLRFLEVPVSETFVQSSDAVTPKTSMLDDTEDGWLIELAIWMFGLTIEIFMLCVLLCLCLHYYEATKDESIYAVSVLAKPRTKRGPDHIEYPMSST
ncbi:hypothetical protein EVAR_63464_1 [Eumeta japonica]|uniref:Uncharacterized protein n=1 Tax=Eumeta variegata TaxID=151549 RepID=A0A4C1YC11_EUMVA|nr:hypothetical protein EVAR_63464_1 [Eumeta japonica]